MRKIMHFIFFKFKNINKIIFYFENVLAMFIHIGNIYHYIFIWLFIMY